jgi:hypothetical protein
VFCFWVSDQMVRSLIWLIFSSKRKLSFKYVRCILRSQIFACFPIFFFFFFFFLIFWFLMCFFFFLKLVVLYVDFKLDESYTPSKISIRSGDGFHNLKVSSLVLDYVNNL